MRLRIGAVLAEAGALWRRDRDLLLRVAGPFLFLPAFAVQLLAPFPDALPDEALAAVLRRQGAFAVAHAGLFLPALALTQLGAVTLITLYCDRERPPLRQAMRRGLQLLPRYLLASMLVELPAEAGLLLFLVPGLLVMARTMLVGPLLVAEAPLGVVAALGRSVRATAGHTLTLAAVAAIALGAEVLAGRPLLALDHWLRALHDTNPVALAMADAAFAATNAAAGLAGILFAVAAYRLIVSANNGT